MEEQGAFDASANGDAMALGSCCCIDELQGKRWSAMVHMPPAFVSLWSLTDRCTSRPQEHPHVAVGVKSNEARCRMRTKPFETLKRNLGERLLQVRKTTVLNTFLRKYANDTNLVKGIWRVATIP